MSRPAAHAFEAALGLEPDGRVPFGQASSLHAYPGPIRLRGDQAAVVDKCLGQIARSSAPGSGMAEIVVGVFRSADRLQIVWNREQAVGFTAARWIRTPTAAGWYVTLSCVEPDASGRGLFTTTLRRLLTERPASFMACTTDSPAVRRTFRHLSPGRTLFPEPGRPPPDRVVALGRDVLRCAFGAEAAAGLDVHLARARRQGAGGDVGVARTGRGASGARTRPGEGTLILADVDGCLHRPDIGPAPNRPRLVGVTGTNGKTSVVEYGRQLSQGTGTPSASFGTLGVVTGIGRRPRPRVGRGPRAIPDLADRVWKLGSDVLWFEAFSHSLAEGLIDQTAVDVAVLTHIDLDHLGVHGSPAAYRAAKTRLFDRCLGVGGTAVFDPDSPGAADIVAVCRRRGIDTVRLGASGDVDLRLVDVATSTARLSVHGVAHDVHLPTSAPYQRANLLCALGAAIALGVPAATLAEVVGRLRSPPGRLEYLDTGLDHDVVVDAAHNGSGLEATLRHLRTTTDGRVLALIASVGNADRNRWESLGEAASVLADEVVITDESPYSRHPAVVRAGLLAGCPGATEVPDRRAAIRWLLDRASPGDVVVLAGRADEDFVVNRAGRRPFPTDAELVVAALASDA